MPDLTLFATIHPKPEFFKQALEALNRIVEPTLQESGCKTFTVHTTKNADESPRKIYLFEVWRDEEALDFHYQQAYSQNVFEQYKLWLEEPVHVIKMCPER